ncbi:MAG: LuxR C-terminal-related transcriptional regulator [Anaerolineae bacterium]
MTIHVVLADDHAMVREGLRTALENVPDIDVIGEARNGTEALHLVSKLHPDVLLLDLVVMPGPRPSEIAAEVRRISPETKTLILTAHERDAFLAELVDTNAVGFLNKEKKSSHLIQAIRRAARGEILFTKTQRARAHRWRKSIGRRWAHLTRREREVLRLLVKGYSNQEIANTQNVTEKTIEYHMTNILCKLGVNSRLEAVVWVHENIPKPW